MFPFERTLAHLASTPSSSSRVSGEIFKFSNKRRENF